MRATVMTAKRIQGVALVLGMIAIGGCGAASSKAPPPSHAASGASPAAPGDARRAAMVIRQAFAANPAANSGHVSGTIGIHVKGVPHFRLPITLTMVGRFSDSPGSALAGWDELLGLEVHGLVYGAGMTSSSGRVYLNIGSTAYVLPQSTVALMAATASSAHNGLMKLLGGFGLRPQSWVRNPQIVGNEQIDSVGVVHLGFAIDPRGLFVDAGHFSQLLTALRVAGLTNLPEAIGPAAQAALVHSVTSAHGDVYLGASDHVIRRARMAMTLTVPSAERRALGGMTSASVNVSLDVTEVGAPQKITVQRDQQSWAHAIPLLDAVAFSNRPPGQRGE